VIAERAAGLVLLRAHLKIAFGADAGLTTMSNVDLRVIQKANGAFAVGH
jgi:hypothetical protein